MTAPLAVITGAAGGIGAALSERLAGEGWRLHLIDPDADRLRALSDRLGSKTTPVGSRLDTPKSCQDALPSGPIDALVHLAGRFVPDHMPPGDRSIYDEALQVNATNAYDLTGAAAAQMRRGGKIVFTSSMSFTRGAHCGPAIWSWRLAFRGFPMCRSSKGRMSLPAPRCIPVLMSAVGPWPARLWWWLAPTIRPTTLPAMCCATGGVR